MKNKIEVIKVFFDNNYAASIFPAFINLILFWFSFAKSLLVFIQNVKERVIECKNNLLSRDYF